MLIFFSIKYWKLSKIFLFFHHFNNYFFFILLFFYNSSFLLFTLFLFYIFYITFCSFILFTHFSFYTKYIISIFFLKFLLINIVFGFFSSSSLFIYIFWIYNNWVDISIITIFLILSFQLFTIILTIYSLIYHIIY